MKREAPSELPTYAKQVLKNIGSKVRMHRKFIAKNYEDFSHEYNFNKITISRIENGKNYTMSTFIQVLHAMQITLEDFFVGIK